MTTTTPTAVQHVSSIKHPWLGVGLVIRRIGSAKVVVQWPGLPMTREESVLDVEPAVLPRFTRGTFR
jgi:hypothetical protein